jgi:GntR family transcriptional regulator
VFIRVEASSGVPITRQIGDQILAKCASGSLRPGDRLPSVRELARELAVNQNTILRVYERLTHEGVLERKHGDGTYVAQKLPRRPLNQPREQLEAQVRRLAEQAAELGLERDELLALVDRAITQTARANKESAR